MAAGSIIIDLLMRTGAFSTDVKRAEKEIKQLTDKIKNFAVVAGTTTAAVATGFAFLTKQSINAMDQMDEMSQSLGLSVEQISRLGNVAKVEGFNLEEFGATMSKLTKTIADARSGAEGAGDVFKALGLDPAAFRDSEDALLQISDAMSQYSDGLAKSAIAQELFGKSGYKFIAFLNQGSEGINQVANELALFSQANTDAAVMSGQFNDTLSKLGIVAESIIQKFAIGILPALNNTAQAFFDAYLQADGMREEMGKLIATNMVRWAENIGIALAHIVDVGVMVARVMVAIGSSIRVVANDVMVLVSAMKFLTPAGVTDTMAVYKQLQESLDARKDALEFATDAYEKVFNSNGAFFSQLTMQAVEMSRLAALLPNDEDFGVSPNIKRNAPTLVKPDKAGAKDLEKMANMLAEAKKLGAEYEREREHSLDMLKIRDRLVGMTENERRVQETVNEVLDATSKALEQIADKREAAAGRGASAEVLAEYDRQAEKVTELGNRFAELARTQEETSIAAQRTFSFGWNTALRQYAEDATNYAQQASDMFSAVTGNMSAAIDNFVDNGKFAFGDFATSILKDLLKIELKMRAMQLFRMGVGAIMGAIGSTSTAATHSGMAYGGTEEFSDLIPMATGGYTGSGNKYEPAGIVHKGEYVLNAEATKRIGVAKLDMLNGYANGGYVGNAPTGMMGNAVNINIKNEAGADGYQATATASRNETGLNVEVLVRRAVTNDMRNNGPMAQSISGAFGLRRTA